MSTTPDIPLLRKAVEWVEEQDKRPFDQREWDQNAWKRRPQAGCGTAYCVAGYIAEVVDGKKMVQHDCVDMDEGTTLDQRRRGFDPDLVHVSNYARWRLGLTQAQANSLFAGSNTAADIRRLAEDFAGERL